MSNEEEHSAFIVARYFNRLTDGSVSIGQQFANHLTGPLVS